jgi:hypothetical protein
MDLHLYNTERHDTTRHDNYETRSIAIKITILCCNISFFNLAIVKETTKGWNF